MIDRFPFGSKFATAGRRFWRPRAAQSEIPGTRPRFGTSPQRQAFPVQPFIFIAAVNDHTIALGRFARYSNMHPHFLLGLALAYWESARAAPEFLRSITLNYLSSNLDMHEEVRRCGIRMLCASLRHSETIGVTRQGINVRSVARNCSALIVAAIHEWTIGSYGLDELRSELATSVGSILTNALNPSMAPRIEEWLATVH
jgi:hypothetical protein